MRRAGLSRRRLPLWFAVAAALTGCDGDRAASQERGQQNGRTQDAPASADDAPPATVHFDTATAYVLTGTDSLTLRVEIAERADQRAYGLMDRDELADDAGMVFLYPRPQSGQSGFWMYRTRIPLDIAFFDEAGRIVATRQMQPCTSPDPARCETYAPGRDYTGALEVNRGYLARHGVEVGDRIRLPYR